MTLGISVVDGGTKNPRISTALASIPIVFGTAKGEVAGEAPTDPVLISTFAEYVELMGWAGTDEDTVNHDYTLDEFAYMLFKVKKGSPFIAVNVYNKTDHSAGVSAVDAADITAALTKANSAVADLGYMPAFLLAPRYSADGSLQTAMLAYSTFSGLPCMVLIDADDTDAVADVITTATAITADNVYLCYPERGGFPLSTIIAAEAVAVDASNGGVPFGCPSNRPVGVAKLEAENTITIANYASLDAKGVATVKRVPGGTERLHIFHTCAYDASGTADYINDSYLPRRMANYLDVALTMKLADRVDSAVNQKLIEDVVAEINGLGGALLGKGAVIGFNCEFLPDDNPIEDLQTGQIVIRITWLPVTQANPIIIKRTVDLDMFSALFA